ncbi:acylphosphatase [Aeribacillus composti]|nr:acylphosphatase [Aeribacillus composti]
MKQYHIIVSGRVQGVGFRYFTRSSTKFPVGFETRWTERLKSLQKERSKIYRTFLPLFKKVVLFQKLKIYN